MLRFRLRPLLALCAIATTLALAVFDADARIGRGGSFGSRGCRPIRRRPRPRPRRPRGPSSAA